LPTRVADEQHISKLSPKMSSHTPAKELPQFASNLSSRGQRHLQTVAHSIDLKYHRARLHTSQDDAEKFAVKRESS
jgi:hypothetical protein